MNEQNILDRIEAYNFECSAGPLSLCDDWKELRGKLEALIHHDRVKPGPNVDGNFRNGLTVGWQIAVDRIRAILTSSNSE